VSILSHIQWTAGELFLGIRRSEHEADLLFLFSDGLKNV
jgi:hypothetical protein